MNSITIKPEMNELYMKIILLPLKMNKILMRRILTKRGIESYTPANSYTIKPFIKKRKNEI